MLTADLVLPQHPFLADLPGDQLEPILRCTNLVNFPAGAFLFREGEAADRFYALTHGRVAVQIDLPDRSPLTIQTIQAGEVLGWSWLYPPYRWHFDAQAVTLVRALAFDAEGLRAACEQDHSLGYALTHRFAHVLFDRLESTQLQLLDVYGVY